MIINVGKIIKESINEYLDKEYGKPLFDYLAAKNISPSNHKYINDVFGDKDIKTNNQSDKYVFTKPDVFKTDWLIHIQNQKGNIANSGFKYAFPADKKEFLWCTGNYQERTNSGYIFAFPADKRIDLVVDECDSQFYNSVKYVMFRASGVKTKNLEFKFPTDEIIIYNKTAKDFINLRRINYNGCRYFAVMPYYNGEYDFFITKKTKVKPLYISRKLSMCIEWVKQNYRQYSNLLFKK
jgi:hypothetical protein